MDLPVRCFCTEGPLVRAPLSPVLNQGPSNGGFMGLVAMPSDAKKAKYFAQFTLKPGGRGPCPAVPTPLIIKGLE